VKQLIKRFVSGTPLEPMAHKLYQVVTGKPPLGPMTLTQLEIYDLQTEQVLERVLKRRSNCVDVGCHEGLILDAMIKNAPGGTHHAFEPLPDLYADLERKYAGRANVVLHRLALSDAAGESTFHHVVSNPGYSGILERHYDRPGEEVVQIHVKLARLDDVLPQDFPVRAIKIDVEGAEYQVLKGAQRTFERWRPYVLFEHGLGAADIYGTRPEMVFDFMRDSGLQITTMERFLERPGSGIMSREQFVDEFNTGRNYQFMAHAPA
jgi:FkbM family methyltransferase